MECIDILYGLEPEKSQYIEDLNANHENFTKWLLIKLSEKYKKEIVGMAINLQIDGDEEEPPESERKKEPEEEEGE